MPKAPRRALLGWPVVAAVVGIALAACSSAPVPASSQTSASAAVSSATPLPTFGALPTTPLAAERVAALQAVLDGMVAQGLPDALATVITPEGIWSGASGVDGPNGQLAEPTDVVAIASISKTFTAALVFKLAEDGRIDLDAPLSQYLDADAAALSNGATVRQALAMRSGIPDTPDDVRTAMFVDPAKEHAVAQVVASLPKAESKPGTEMIYSNPTYKLLGLAAERAGGAPLADLITTELVEPAGVTGTLVQQTPGVRTPGRWAVPIEAGPWGTGGTLPFVADTSFLLGASAMAGDTPSVAQWAWQLFAGEVVSPASLALMAETGGSDEGSGLGPFGAPLPDGTLGHGGIKQGYKLQLAVVPDLSTVVVLAINQEDAEPDPFSAQLLDAATG